MTASTQEVVIIIRNWIRNLPTQQKKTTTKKNLNCTSTQTDVHLVALVAGDQLRMLTTDDNKMTTGANMAEAEVFE